MAAVNPAIASRCHAVLECPHACKELREAAQRLLKPAPLAQPTLQQLVSAPAATSSWKCKNCTLVNAQGPTLACTACGAARPLQPGAAWPCSKCTFTNRAQRSKCEVCTEPRPAAAAVSRPAEKRVEKRRRRGTVAAAMTDGDDDFA